MSCEYQERLLDLLYGDVKGEAAARLEREVSACPDCAEDLATLREARGLAALLPLEEPPRGPLEVALRAAEAARLPAAHAEPRRRALERGVPWWRRRWRGASAWALAGSLTAALALVYVLGEEPPVARAPGAVPARGTSELVPEPRTAPSPAGEPRPGPLEEQAAGRSTGDFGVASTEPRASRADRVTQGVRETAGPPLRGTAKPQRAARQRKARAASSRRARVARSRSPLPPQAPARASVVTRAGDSGASGAPSRPGEAAARSSAGPARRAAGRLSADPGAAWASDSVAVQPMEVEAAADSEGDVLARARALRSRGRCVQAAARYQEWLRRHNGHAAWFDVSLERVDCLLRSGSVRAARLALQDLKRRFAARHDRLDPWFERLRVAESERRARSRAASRPKPK